MIHNSPSILLQGRSTVVGLIGLAGCGKSVASRVFCEEFGFALVRPGKHISEYIKAKGLVDMPSNERLAQSALRKKYGMGALLKISRDEIQSLIKNGHHVLIDAMCSFSELDYLSDLIGMPKIYVVGIHAPLSKRREWIQSRPLRPHTLKELSDRDLLEVDKLEKGKLLALSDYHVVNDSAKHTFKRRVRRLASTLIEPNDMPPSNS